MKVVLDPIEVLSHAEYSNPTLLRGWLWSDTIRRVCSVVGLVCAFTLADALHS